VKTKNYTDFTGRDPKYMPTFKNIQDFVNKWGWEVPKKKDDTCPSGKFSTTGKWHGCDCPAGSRKDYLDVFKAKARCVTSGSGGKTDKIIRPN